MGLQTGSDPSGAARSSQEQPEAARRRQEQPVVARRSQEHMIPQTVLALRGSNGVGIEGAMVGARENPFCRGACSLVIYSTW